MGESFSGLLKTRPVAKTRRLRLHVLRGQACVAALGLAPHDVQPRFGVLVPKRLVRRAVDRNAIKRLCRLVCRQVLDSKNADPKNLNTSTSKNNLALDLALGATPQPCAVLVCITQTTLAVPPSEHAAWLAELYQLFAYHP